MSDAPTDLSVFATDAATITSVPSTDQVRSIAEGATLLVAATNRVKELEAALDAAKAERKRLAHDVLPPLFDEAGTDRIGLPDDDLDLVIRPYYHASIGGDMPPDQQEAAFDHVEDLGGGNLLSTVIEIKLNRNQLEEARNLLERLRGMNDLPEGVIFRLTRGIPWATLTSFLREFFERRDDVLQSIGEGEEPPAPYDKTPNLELLGATVGRVAKIEKRPRRKGRR